MGGEGETGMLGERLGKSKAGLRWREKGQNLRGSCALFEFPAYGWCMKPGSEMGFPRDSVGSAGKER